MRGGGKVFDEEGKEIPGGGKGYRYFGRARELPGVKEMFEASKPKVLDKALETRADLRKNVDASYYGYNLDEEDGTLIAYESAKEQEAMEALEAQAEHEDKNWEPLPGDSGDGIGWRLPTLDEVEQELVARKGRTLLDKVGLHEDETL